MSIFIIYYFIITNLIHVNSISERDSNQISEKNLSIDEHFDVYASWHFIQSSWDNALKSNVYSSHPDFVKVAALSGHCLIAGIGIRQMR